MAINVQIKIVETGVISVDADNSAEAEQIAAEMYENGDFIFDNEGVDDFDCSLEFNAVE